MAHDWRCQHSFHARLYYALFPKIVVDTLTTFDYLEGRSCLSYHIVFRQICARCFLVCERIAFENQHQVYLEKKFVHCLEGSDPLAVISSITAKNDRNVNKMNELTASTYASWMTYVSALTSDIFRNVCIQLVLHMAVFIYSEETPCFYKLFFCLISRTLINRFVKVKC